MMELTREMLQTRLRELDADKRAHVAELDSLEKKHLAHESQINAIMGAMQEVQAWLGKLDTAEGD